MATGTFGENLKRERELRGVTLEEISAATRIATRFLQAIENERWEQLPGGVFNRGFVRAMARYLGLDEENIVAEYTLAVGDRPSVPVWTGRPPVVTPEHPWLAWIIIIIIILALAVGGWVGARLLLARRAARQAVQAPEASVASTPLSANASLQIAGDSNASGAGTAAGAQNAISGAAGEDSAAVPATNSPETDKIELKIEVAKRTKVTVVTDQDLAFDGTMKANENHFFSASDHIQVSAKDAEAIRLTLNGKALAPLGPAGQPGKITLTRDALKGAKGGGN